MDRDPDTLLTSFLRDVSRSFYLTLRVLPGRIRVQVGLAYLLARTTDTIADTELVPVDQRLAALEALRDRILGRSRAPLQFGDLAPRQGSRAEQLLLVRCEETLGALDALSDADRQLVRRVLDIITSGQEQDLRRFGNVTPGHPLALQTDEELDHYTYCVAGCVGEFWTRMCRVHLFPHASLDETEFLGLGVRFGKGLQLVNILRDMPADLRRGRCYLPQQQLGTQNLKPEDLLEPANELSVRPLYDSYLARAGGHLQAGWEYTNLIPARHVRLRLACAWPVLIGVETVKLLKTRNILAPEPRLKVSRGQVRNIMLRSVLLLPCPPLWRRMAPGNC